MRGEVSAGLAANLELAMVKETLQAGERYLREAGVGSARLDAELLLGKVLGAGREKLYLDFDRTLQAVEERRFRELLLRRGRREPLAYILGEKEFWSLDFIVTPDVLVPRPETERLVEAALGLVNHRPKGTAMRVLDLGTGSGAIAVSLAKERSDLELWATDLSIQALEVARVNALLHDASQRIRFRAGDLFGPVEELRDWFHVLVSNPPYVTQSEIDNLPPEVREWEPRLALCGGSDGLDFYRRVIQEGPLYLVRDGFMALEISADMAKAVSGLFAAAGCYSTPSVYQDLAGRDRVVVAQLNRASMNPVSN